MESKNPVPGPPPDADRCPLTHPRTSERCILVAFPSSGQPHTGRQITKDGDLWPERDGPEISDGEAEKQIGAMVARRLASGEYDR